MDLWGARLAARRKRHPELFRPARIGGFAGGFSGGVLSGPFRERGGILGSAISGGSPLRRVLPLKLPAAEPAMPGPLLGIVLPFKPWVARLAVLALVSPGACPVDRAFAKSQPGKDDWSCKGSFPFE